MTWSYLFKQTEAVQHTTQKRGGQVQCGKEGGRGYCCCCWTEGCEGMKDEEKDEGDLYCRGSYVGAW
jgi:hypothetical protein